MENALFLVERVVKVGSPVLPKVLLSLRFYMLTFFYLSPLILEGNRKKSERKQKNKKVYNLTNFTLLLQMASLSMRSFSMSRSCAKSMTIPIVFSRK